MKQMKSTISTLRRVPCHESAMFSCHKQKPSNAIATNCMISHVWNRASVTLWIRLRTACFDQAHVGQAKRRDLLQYYLCADYCYVVVILIVALYHVFEALCDDCAMYYNKGGADYSIICMQGSAVRSTAVFSFSIFHMPVRAQNVTFFSLTAAVGGVLG